MSDKQKGYQDPWRIAPKDPPTEAPAGAKGSTHELDVDLLPHKECCLRARGAAGALLIHGAQTPNGAVKMLLAAVQRSSILRNHLSSYGFQLGEGKPEQGFYLTDGEMSLHNPRARNALDGFNKLVMCLRRGVREAVMFRKELNRVGVLPLNE